MIHDDAKALLVRLAAIAKAEKLAVVYWSPEGGLQGAFSANPWPNNPQPRPQIFLYRERPPEDFPNVEGDVLQECITFSHEFGHYRSWRAGRGVSDELVAVADKDWTRLSLKDRQLLYAEEEVAWAHARTLLAGLGFVAWDAFEARRKKGLDVYVEKLSLGPMA